MNRNFASLNSTLEKTMTTEQFEEIVEAIVSGKYSWACVLILRFANYNPLHYIPYRTYKRLIKDNQNKDNLNNFKTTKLPSKQVMSGLK